MMMVSKKVPVIETRPCFTHESVFAAAAAIGALPKPDSLENTPRAIPDWIASMILAPKKPPVAAVLVNAEVTTRVTAFRSWSAFETRTLKHATMYIIAIVGTTFPATLAID